MSASVILDVHSQAAEKKSWPHEEWVLPSSVAMTYS